MAMLKMVDMAEVVKVAQFMDQVSISISTKMLLKIFSFLAVAIALAAFKLGQMYEQRKKKVVEMKQVEVPVEVKKMPTEFVLTKTGSKLHLRGCSFALGDCKHVQVCTRCTKSYTLEA